VRTFSAPWVFPVSSPPIKDGTVTVDDNGTIVAVEPAASSDSISTPSGQPAEMLNGILVPGFINTHCHLELSHMKGQVREKKGMAGFISELVPKRNKFSVNEIKAAVAAAEEEMIRNGIVAIGDISNTDHSFEQKAKGNIYYHTFIEVFDLDPSRAQEEFDKGRQLRRQLLTLNLKFANSLVPHAPYSVTPDLYDLLSTVDQEITCIHNQESKAENELFNKKSGSLLEMFEGLGYYLDWLEETGKNSIRSSLPYLMRTKNVQLVHNTYTSKKDLGWAMSFEKDPPPGSKGLKLYWCTCPNANIYIEDKLPDYKLFIEAGATMTVGTDSYASNWSLSILDELKTIQKRDWHLELPALIQWATKNGAEFLGISKIFGTLEKGKRPGLVLIENCDLENLKLKAESVCRRLV
jgi:cytosine/adenosine deaminase-related metal-dependent hydrolase